MKSGYQKAIYMVVFCLAILFSSGCAFFRHNIIPQEKREPHGSALALIDQRMPEYIEFAVPGDKEWIFKARIPRWHYSIILKIFS